MKKQYHIGIRHREAELNYKLQYIAKYEGRTGNGQILHLIRKSIWDFEAKHGEIPMPENKDD